MNVSKRTLLNTCFSLVIGFCMLPTLFILWFMLKGIFQSSEELTSMLAPAIYHTEGYAVWNWLPKDLSLFPKIEDLMETKQFFTAFENSLLIAVPAILGQFCLAAPAAWAMSRLRFPGKKLLMGFYICLMLLPFQVTMLPNYLVISRINLMDTLWAVILPVAFSAFPVYIMTKGFNSVHREIVEAAQVDGAGYLRIFMQIGLPVGRPGVIAALILGFLECWSLVEQPMIFLRSTMWWPLSIYMTKLIEMDLGIGMLASVLMVIPAMLVFLFGQKYLVLGIQYAGVKE